MFKNSIQYAVFCFLLFPLVLPAQNSAENTVETGQLPRYASGEITGSEDGTSAAPAFLGGDFAQNVTEEEDILIDEEKSIESEEDILEGSVEEKKPQESKPKEEKIDTKNAGKEKETPSPSPSTPDKKETMESKKQEATQDTTSKKTVEDIDDMDIILEDEDELIISDDKEELLITEEPKKDTTAAPEVLKSKADTAVVGPDSLKQATTPVVEGEEIIGETEADQKIEKEVVVQKKSKKKKATIEEASSINFAKNLKEYRSPRKAMFMSLLVPGLGQAYTKKYWKTAVLGVLEAALIGFAVKHSIDGKDQLERARDYADEHYDPEKFFTFYGNFMKFFKPDSPAVDFALIFGDTLDNYEADFKGIIDKSHDEKKRPDFDKYIQYDNKNPSPFVQGWDDCEPTATSNGYDIDTTGNSNYLYNYTFYNIKDTTWLLKRIDNGGDTLESGIFGYSLHQQEYTRIISLSNHYYTVSRYLIFSLVVNHLISAVDAFISARSYNDMLLNKKSVWRRIDIDHQVALGDYGFESRLDLKVKF